MCDEVMAVMFNGGYTLVFLGFKFFFSLKWFPGAEGGRVKDFTTMGRGVTWWGGRGMMSLYLNYGNDYMITHLPKFIELYTKAK